jgi:hypothetical protein
MPRTAWDNWVIYSLNYRYGDASPLAPYNLDFAPLSRLGSGIFAIPPRKIPRHPALQTSFYHRPHLLQKHPEAFRLIVFIMQLPCQL